MEDIVKGLEDAAQTGNVLYSEAIAEIKRLRKKVSDEATLDEVIGRWQLEIYRLCCSIVTVDGEEQINIDGGGCDSGDPLDFTLDEISQAANYWIDRCHESEKK